MLKTRKKAWKMGLLFTSLLMITSSGLLTADAAKAPVSSVSVEKKPYEYDFVAKETNNYNEFNGAKDLEITFDKPIRQVDANQISVYQIGETPQELSIIKKADVSGNTLTINFKNLELIDQSKGIQFKLVIPKDTLYYDQLTQYEFPFALYELLPGFGSVFANDANSILINNNIFVNNAPRDVAVFLPKLYISKIETIHRNNGLIENKLNTPLTNIDIQSDPDAQRMKVKFEGTSSKGIRDRDLERRTDIPGFSMGQAGIDALTCKDGVCENTDDFELTAFDGFGKKLTTRSFKIKMNDIASGTSPSKKDFTINDYVKTPDKAFGQKKSLYDLMTDIKVSKPVFEQLPVNEYNKIGILYSLGDTISVENEEQLQMALNNNNFKTINILKDMSFTDGTLFPNDTLTIKRSVTINGGGKTFNGHVKLGDGESNITVRLKDLTVTDTLNGDVGTEGSAILERFNGNIENLVGSVYQSNGTPDSGVGPSSDNAINLSLAKSVTELTENGVPLDGIEIIDPAVANIRNWTTVSNDFGSTTSAKLSDTRFLTIEGLDTQNYDRVGFVKFQGVTDGKTYQVIIHLTITAEKIGG